MLKIVTRERSKGWNDLDWTENETKVKGGESRVLQ
jgi:hypothetical protein